MLVRVWSNSELDIVAGNVAGGLISSLIIPAGLKAPDGSAEVGLNGHLFLTEGSNNLAGLYAAELTDDMDALVRRWVDLFDRRGAEASRRGIDYLQFVIPEKLSVLNASALLPISGPTVALSGLESLLGERRSYLSTWDVLSDWSGFDDPYLSTDTHFTAAGAQRLFAAAADQLDPSISTIVRGVTHGSCRYIKGDLAERFHGIPFHSRVLEPGPEVFSEYRPGLSMVERHFPVRGSIGRRFRWVNTTAASSKKVVVFGNSFFSEGSWAGLLSWWGKHLFAEFHFIWDPVFDWDLVDELAPDIVIGQTVERFLPTVPPH
jgi:hypothetical protein